MSNSINFNINLGDTEVEKVIFNGTTIWQKDNYLLDNILGVSTALALRQLKTDSTNCIRVRRSSDNTEQDIGFVNGVLDTTSLLDFSGSDSCYVSTAYDPSENSNDWTQTDTSKQPRIVNNGVLDTANNKPAIYFDGSSYLQSSLSSAPTARTLISIVKVPNYTQCGTILGAESAGGFQLRIVDTSGKLQLLKDNIAVLGSSSSASSTNLIIAAVVFSSSSYVLELNGTSVASGTPSQTFVNPDLSYIGRKSNTGENFIGYVSEVIDFESVASDDIKETIINDQKTYYGIT